MAITVKSDVAHTQMAPPASRAAMGREPGYHYLKVQKDSARDGWDSSFDEYLDMESPTRPGQPMYAEYSQDRRVTGHNQMMLLRCTEEDFKAYQDRLTELNRSREFGAQAKGTQGEEDYRRLRPLAESMQPSDLKEDAI